MMSHLILYLQYSVKNYTLILYVLMKGAIFQIFISGPRSRFFFSIFASILSEVSLFKNKKFPMLLLSINFDYYVDYIIR